MPRRKTNQEWVTEVKDIVGNEYFFLNTYINKSTKIRIRHNTCKTEYEVSPGGFLQGNRCPNCRTNRLKTTHEFKQKVYQLTGHEYSIQSEYIGHHKPISIKHETCGRVYKVAPSDFLKGRRCKRCIFNDKKKTNKAWVSQVELLTGNEYNFLDTYQGDSIKLRYKHSCGGIHTVTPNNFINGSRCPLCQESSGESNIRLFLSRQDIIFQPQATFPGLTWEKPLKYDFYLPGHKMLIEFQGIQHYEPVDLFGGKESFKLQCLKDNVKRQYAKKAGLKLIEISYKHNTYQKIESLLGTTIPNKPNAT